MRVDESYDPLLMEIPHDDEADIDEDVDLIKAPSDDESISRD